MNLKFMKRVYRSPTSVLSNSLPLQCPGGLVPEKLGGVCGLLPKTLIQLMTKICDIPYPIYDLAKNSKPYL